MRILASTRTEVAILQLEQYQLSRFWRVDRSKEKAVLGMQGRMKWTLRARLVYCLALTLRMVIWSPRSAVAVAAAPAMLIAKMAKYYWYYQTKSKIARLQKRGLKVVVIAGSYGKTSVKNYAYDLLRGNRRVVATPESYNTLLGIAKVVRWELDEKTEVFLCEAGAYGRGEITRLCAMVNPEVGVLTGITSQHLERFGSMQQIVSAKMEVLEWVQKNGNVVVANMGDKTVAKEVERRAGLEVIGYGEKGQVVWSKLTQVGLEGSRGLMIIEGNTIKFSTKIIGSANVQNLEGAVATSLASGMRATQIAKRVGKVRAVPHRFELTDRYGVTTIDNAYSSNEKGMEEALAFLREQKSYTRILVTPGLVELGEESARVHERMGKKISQSVDRVILVGSRPEISILEKSIVKAKVARVEKTLDFVELVKGWNTKKPPLVLIENDLTENYG